MTDMEGVHLHWILVVLLLFMISNICRALRWQQVCDSMGYTTRFGNSFWTIMLGYFANLGLPRMGEVVRIGAFSKYENMPLEKVTGGLALGRIIDVLSLLLVIGLAFTFEFETFYNLIQTNFSGVGSLPLKLGILAVVGISLLAGGYYFIKKSSHKYALKLKSLATGFWEGLISVRNVKNIPMFVFYSIAIWVMYFMMTYVCFWSFDPTQYISLTQGLTIFVFGAIGMVFPSPGGMGSYQLFLIQGMSLYGISGDDGFTFSNIIFFSINIFCNVAFGLLSLIFLPLINKNNS